MSNWITALIMARELCNLAANKRDLRADETKSVGDHPDNHLSKNNASDKNSLTLRAEALFQEAVYQQALDSIWNSASKVVDILSAFWLLL